MNKLSLILGATLFVLSLKLGDALVCLNCESVLHPKLCHHVATCFKGEKCGMSISARDGDMKYKLGCVDEYTCTVTDNTTSVPDSALSYTCNHCCDDHDLCNARGCNTEGFPPNRGPLCYNCESYPAGYPCHVIDHCEPHELCFNDNRVEYTTDRLFTSGCRSKHNCASSLADPALGFGKRSDVTVRSTVSCTSCCFGDLCNTQCNNEKVPCHDDPTCALLMQSYDVCKAPDIALKLCRKSCNLCSKQTKSVCSNSRVDCPNIKNQVHDMCSTRQNAIIYGCLDFCGYCSDKNETVFSSTTPPYVATTAALRTITSIRTTTTAVGTTTLDIETTMVAMGTPIPFNLGDKVVRGDNWTRQNEDGHGAGVIIGMPPSIEDGWVRVTWDNNYTDIYRNGALTLLRITTISTTPILSTVKPSIPLTYGPALTNNMYIGARVQRGPDWKWNDQDGNGSGTIIDLPPKTSPGWARVHWDNNNTTNTYRAGAENASDLAFVPGTYSPSTNAPSQGNIVFPGNG